MTLDDPLELLGRRFGDERLVVFYGMSGSGKSTYINLLLERHSEFAGCHSTRMGPAPIVWGVRPPTELVVVDEMQRAGDVVGVLGLLRRGHRVLAASHVPTVWTRLLGLRWRAAHFRTDASAEKFAPLLSRRGVSFTGQALRRFERLYGASYTDLDIVLERFPGVDLDRALDRFAASATISVVRARSSKAPRRSKRRAS